MHAKNLSLLHLPDGSMTLSPAYDVVPQTHQPNDGEVALAVGGEYRHAAITMKHLIAEVARGGLRRQPILPKRRSPQFSNWRTQRPPQTGLRRLARNIFGFVSNLLAGRVIGASGHHRLAKRSTSAGVQTESSDTALAPGAPAAQVSDRRIRGFGPTPMRSGGPVCGTSGSPWNVDPACCRHLSPLPP